MTEELFLVVRQRRDLALIQCHNVADATYHADNLDENQWVSEQKRPGPKYEIQTVKETSEMNYWTRPRQPHLCVQYDISCFPKEVEGYSPMDPEGLDHKVTVQEAYLPHDLVLHFKLADAFRLWTRVDPRHIYRVVDEMYTREGEHYTPHRDGEWHLPPEYLASLM